MLLKTSTWTNCFLFLHESVMSFWIFLLPSFLHYRNFNFISLTRALLLQSLCSNQIHLILFIYILDFLCVLPFIDIHYFCTEQLFSRYTFLSLPIKELAQGEQGIFKQTSNPGKLLLRMNKNLEYWITWKWQIFELVCSLFISDFSISKQFICIYFIMYIRVFNTLHGLHCYDLFNRTETLYRHLSKMFLKNNLRLLTCDLKKL